MSFSVTRSDTTTFTLTHAKKLASKVATDLKRMQRFYGEPSDKLITGYEDEITAFLKGGYLKAVTYGFRRSGKWIEPTITYTAEDLNGRSANDDDPGRVMPGANIQGASFGSYLEYSSSWRILSQQERDDFQRSLPIQREPSPKPGVEGYLESDRTYSSGGRALNRSSVKSYR